MLVWGRGSASSRGAKPRHRTFQSQSLRSRKFGFCDTSGSCRGKSNPKHDYDGKPSEHYGEGGPTFDLADAGYADGGQDQGPNTEDIQRCQQGAEHRRAVPADEISGIGGHRILNVESITADSRQKRQYCQQRRQ